MARVEDQTAHIERKQAKDRSRELLACEKSLTDEALKALLERYQDAAKRAQALDDKHAKDGSPPRSNPSSNVWRLIERILGPAVGK